MAVKGGGLCYLVDRFKQKSLLRVNRLSLCVSDAEKLGIEEA